MKETMRASEPSDVGALQDLRDVRSEKAPHASAPTYSRLDHDADECGCENHAPWCPFNPYATQVHPYPLPPSVAFLVRNLRDALASLARRWEGPDKPGCWCQRSPILTGEHDVRCTAASAALGENSEPESEPARLTDSETGTAIGSATKDSSHVASDR